MSVKRTKANRLVEAVFNNDFHLVADLLQKGADPNVVEDQDRITPLHFAAQNGSLDMVKLLVTAGAKVNTANAEGKTPLEIAKLHGHEQLVNFLVKASANF